MPDAPDTSTALNFDEVNDSTGKFAGVQVKNEDSSNFPGGPRSGGFARSEQTSDSRLRSIADDVSVSIIYKCIKKFIKCLSMHTNSLEPLSLFYDRTIGE